MSSSRSSRSSRGSRTTKAAQSGSVKKASRNMMGRMAPVMARNRSTQAKTARV